MTSNKRSIIHRFFQENPSAQKDGVDLVGVSIITMGRLHDVRPFSITEKFMLDLICNGNKRKKIKAHIDHTDSLASLVGSFYDFRLSDDKKKVLADFSFFKSADKMLVDRIKNLALESPDMFGVSIVASLSLGNKLEDDSYELEFDHLFSVDFVSEPAANAGLFKYATKTESKMKNLQEWVAEFGVQFATDNYEKIDYAEAKAKFQELSVKQSKMEIEAIKLELEKAKLELEKKKIEVEVEKNNKESSIALSVVPTVGQGKALDYNTALLECIKACKNDYTKAYTMMFEQYYDLIKGQVPLYMNMKNNIGSK